MTSLTNRFEGISISYVPFRARAAPINQVALGFINAMKLQALEDCDQHITSYTYTDTEYENTGIRIRINAAAAAPQGQLVRCNMLYAIKTLGLEQLNREILYGARFLESYHNQPLYSGIFDDLNDPSLEKSSNSSTDPSQAIVQEKGALRTQVLDATNSTTSRLDIPGSIDVEYEVKFFASGVLIPKVDIFSTILEFMMALAQRESDDKIESASQATSTDPAWIFVKCGESSFSLQVFELVAIMESIARWAVTGRHYYELSFYFYIDREIVAHGCVTAPTTAREWCQGLR